MTEDEVIGWHHCLSEHEFEEAPGAGNGQGSLWYMWYMRSVRLQRVGHNCVTELN